MDANKDPAASKESNTQSLAADQRAVAAAVTDPSRGLGNRTGESTPGWPRHPTGCGPARTAAKCSSTGSTYRLLSAHLRQRRRLQPTRSSGLGGDARSTTFTTAPSGRPIAPKTMLKLNAVMAAWGLPRLGRRRGERPRPAYRVRKTYLSALVIGDLALGQGV
jgi:hypothetical protein